MSEIENNGYPAGSYLVKYPAGSYHSRHRLESILARVGEVAEVEEVVDFRRKLEDAKLNRRPNIGKGGNSYNIWTKEAIGFLGKVPDADLGDKLGITQTAVLRKRQILGISSFGNTRGGRPSRWKSEWDKLLGTISDPKLAELLQGPDGFPSKELVRRRRNVLGIKAFRLVRKVVKPCKPIDCEHDRVGLPVDGKRVLRAKGNMVIPSVMCPDCKDLVHEARVEEIRGND